MIEADYHPTKIFYYAGEQILADLISRGYSGNDLLERFKKAQRQIRPAVEVILVEAEQVASSASGHISYEDVFGIEDEK